jgi:glucokinase
MKTFIAIDLGGTNIRVALVDDKLNVIKALREKTIRHDADELYQQISRMVKEIISLAPDKGSLKYVGISAAGFCNGNVLTYSPNIQVSDFPLTTLLEKDFPDLKIVMANDANCSALNEALNGSAKGTKTSYFMTVSSGIGCGLVYDGKLVDLPFEGGHNYVGYNGRFYELEQLCSGNGIVNLAKINGLVVPDAATFFAEVARDDKKAVQVYNDWLKIFGSFCANAQITYAPEVIILSGGVMISKSIFWNDLLSVANAFVAPFPIPKIKFVTAKFEQDTGLMGATAVAMQLANKCEGK